jgi:hypothetical protein
MSMNDYIDCLREISAYRAEAGLVALTFLWMAYRGLRQAFPDKFSK